MSNLIPLTSDIFIAHVGDVQQALAQAVNAALLDHKRAGNSIAVWRDGKVVILKPQDIPVDDPLAGDESAMAGNGST
jgi:hypothetical protein